MYVLVMFTMVEITIKMQKENTNNVIGCSTGVFMVTNGSLCYLMSYLNFPIFFLIAISKRMPLSTESSMQQR